MSETDLQNEIRMALNNVAITFRANVGKFKTWDGRIISTGLPRGFSDLFGFRKSDGRMFFIEVKTPTGKVREDQIKFIERMKALGAIAGIARSVEDALEIVRS